MTTDLLALTNRKHEKHINWKNILCDCGPEYGIKKTNFRTFDRIVNRLKMKQKLIIFRESFGEIKMILEKIWKEENLSNSIRVGHFFHGTYKTYLRSPTNMRMEFKVVTEEEILNIINS